MSIKYRGSGRIPGIPIDKSLITQLQTINEFSNSSFNHAEENERCASTHDDAGILKQAIDQKE